jgi:hypothetical protein
VTCQRAGRDRLRELSGGPAGRLSCPRKSRRPRRDLKIIRRMAGAITQNPIGISRSVVESTLKALKGEKVPKVIDTGFYCYYDKSNIPDPEVAAVLYD